MMHSFLKDEISDQESGIDIEKLFTLFGKLKSIKLEQENNYGSLMQKIISTSFVKIAEFSRFIPFENDIDPRIIIIYLLNTETYEMNNKNIILQIIKLIEPSGYRDILKLWISKFSKQIFKTLVDKCQELISLQSLEVFANIEEIMITGRLPADKLEILDFFLKLMELYYECNKESKYLHPEEFYNEIICEEFHPKIQFRKWLAKMLNPSAVQNLSLIDKFTICDYTFILDLDYKSRILNEESKFEMNEHRNENLSNIMGGNIMNLIMNPSSLLYFHIKVRREAILEDALVQLSGGHNFKMPLQVKFQGEQGVDEGGVRKEFFQLMIKQLFDQIYGMFLQKEEKFWWINPWSLETNINFELVGKILGLAIYNSIYLDVKFPLVIYKKLLDEPLSLEDLREIDPELCKGLQFILDYDGDLEEELDMTFQIEYEMFDEKENGDQVKVTNENKHDYVERYWRWYLIDSIQTQFEYFKKGFYQVVTGKTFKLLFNSEELLILICGSPHIDFEELERAALYHDGYDKNSEVVKWLWEILKGFNSAQKKQFLSFCTGSDRAPIKGLGYMKFIIGRKGADSEELPSAHTCFNHLLIPQYSSKEKLYRKLTLAIENAEGFGLI